MAVNRKVFVVGAQTDYANWCEFSELVSSVAAADLVIFTGGEDVNPMLYGEICHATTRFSFDRDVMESKCFHQAVELKKKILGICRGAQLACVLSGGRLVQHQVDTGYHTIHTKTYLDKDIVVASDHHQSQFPWELPEEEYRILGWTQGLSPFHLSGDGDEMVIGHKKADGREVEICYYSKTQALAIQTHPEWLFPKRLTDKSAMESIVWFRSLLDRLMWGTL